MLAKKVTRLDYKQVLATATSLLTLLTAIVYCAWYFVSIEKRITILEQHDTAILQSFSDMKATLNQANDSQDRALTRLDEKVDKVLFLISEKNNSERS